MTDKKPIDWNNPFPKPNSNGLTDHRYRDSGDVWLIDGFVSTPNGHVAVIYHAAHAIPSLDLSVIVGGVEYCRAHVGAVARRTIVTKAADFAREVAERVVAK